MADGVFNIGRGRLQGAHDAGEDLIVVLLKTAEADATLNDYRTLAAVLAEEGNEEADFTNYERKVIPNANWSVTIDDQDDHVSADFPDQTWANAGGAENNTLVKLVVCIDGDTDADRIPVSHHDWTPTTDGSNLTANVADGGFWRSE